MSVFYANNWGDEVDILDWVIEMEVDVLTYMCLLLSVVFSSTLLFKA